MEGTEGNMPGLVERLRDRAKYAFPDEVALYTEVADKIERLEAALDIARTGLLNIERRSEEARARLTRAADQQQMPSEGK